MNEVADKKGRYQGMSATSNITLTGAWQLATDQPSEDIIMTAHGPEAQYAFSDAGAPSADLLGHVLPSMVSISVPLEVGAIYVRGPEGSVIAVS